MNRRELLRKGGVLAVAASGKAGSAKSELESSVQDVLRDGPVKFTRDGLDLEPLELTTLLASLAKDPGITSDSYSRGGVVQELEKAIAAALGKEDAIFLPTGTLANHLAVTTLCRPGKRRVLTQAESHLFNDAGDGLSALGPLSLLPLAAGKTSFTLAELRSEIERCEGSKVRLGVGAISIETPVRRRDNRRFDLGEMKAISTYARAKGVPLHLDGARLFIESAFSGIAVGETAKLFDSVYVSLYKNFHAPSGAVLAGPSRLIDGLYHERRRFGGGLPQAWPFAAAALPFVPGVVGRLKKAIQVFEALKRSLEDDKTFDFQSLDGGTNVSLLKLHGKDPDAFRQSLRSRGVHLPKAHPKTGIFKLKINETLNRRSAGRLVTSFRACV